MNGSRRGEVITFYSFKGGVGRSMALANVAAIYAQQGKSVLALDFDFEAPGLHRYFLTKDQERYTPEGPQRGVLNLFDALRDRLRSDSPYGQNLVGAEAQSKMRAMVAELLDSGAYKYRVRLKNPNAKEAPPAEVDFIPAARFDATYPDLLRAFDWQDFYDDYAEIFPAIVAELRSRYDFVLVDSRTGVTDIGSICTMVLPDKLVLAFTPNEQSLAGALDAGWQAVQGRKEAPEPRVLSIFPLVSRVEEGEEEQKRKWIADARGRFGQLFCHAYDRPEIDLEPYFNVVRIPHKSFYAYGERIAAEEQAANELGAMAQAFRQLADGLEYPDAMQAQQALAPLVAERTLAQAVAALDKITDMLGKGGKMIEGLQRPVNLLSRIATAASLHSKGRFLEAIVVYDEVIAKAEGASSWAMPELQVSGLLGKIQALAQMERYPEALGLAEDVAQRYAVADTPIMRNAATSALGNSGYVLLCMAKQAWLSEGEVAAGALLKKAESKLELANQNPPQNALVVGYQGYVAFLSGRADEGVPELTRAVALGGAKIREALLKAADTHTLPQDATFRTILACIPDPPAGSSPAG